MALRHFSPNSTCSGNACYHANGSYMVMIQYDFKLKMFSLPVVLCPSVICPGSDPLTIPSSVTVQILCCCLSMLCKETSKHHKGNHILPLKASILYYFFHTCYIQKTLDMQAGIK